MKAYNVEATLSPIADDKDWDELRDLIDVIPGTLLVEDPDAPLLIFPVDAPDDYAAFSLVDGLFRLRSIQPESGKIYEVEDAADAEDDGPAEDCGENSDWKHLVSR